MCVLLSYPCPVYLYFFWYENLFCEFANWLEKSKTWGWFIWFIFISSREGIKHLEHFPALVMLTSQLCDPPDFSMFRILPYLCWTSWEKVCNVCVQLRTEGGLGLSTDLNAAQL